MCPLDHRYNAASRWMVHLHDPKDGMASVEAEDPIYSMGPGMDAPRIGTILLFAQDSGMIQML